MSMDNKVDILKHYIDYEKSYGRKAALERLHTNIEYHAKDPEGRRWREEILREHFGVYDGVPLDWNAQLTDLLSDKTPVYIVE